MTATPAGEGQGATASTSRRPSNARDSFGSPSCVRRSPKRARASPSPRETISSSHITKAFIPRSGSKLPSPPQWEDRPHAATSPCRTPNEPRGGRGARRREMSVPLLSQTLSHVSLSHSTPPLASDFSPDAMTRAPSSSTPPALATPSTATGTPRRLPSLRRMNTPAPLVTRELTYPNTAPMPVIHSLLGSPFTSKAQRYPYELTSPTWVARGAGNRDEPKSKSPVSDWHAEWMEQNDELPELQEASPQLQGSRRFGSNSSIDDGTGSCTSTSSIFSTGRQPSSNRHYNRPSVVTIWGDDGTVEEAEVKEPATPNRPINKGSLLLLQSSPHHPAPRKRVQSSPGSSSREHSPVRSLNLSRRGAVPTPAILEPLDFDTISPMDYIARSSLRKTEPRPRPAYQAFDDAIADKGALTVRRTSEPIQDGGSDAFATFLARCGGDRTTKSDLSPCNKENQAGVLSSDPLDADISPLRTSGSRWSTVAPLPARPQRPTSDSGQSPTAPLQSLKARLDKFKGTPKTKPARPAPRPNMRRGATEPQLQTATPTFGTPVSQLFGDDKPSPAAFASAGLVKKRGSRFSFPRFQEMTKARSWSPLTSQTKSTENDPRKTAKALSKSANEPVDSGSKEVLAADVKPELEDTDEDDLSPIRPMRTAPYRRSISHQRMSSTASDMSITSPYRRTHVRAVSNVSSISGSRGLRRKGSSMFNSAASISSDTASDLGYSPATPTKPLPFASIQPKFGITTPSPIMAATHYPFARRVSVISLESTASPTGTPFHPSGATGRVRALSRAGPIARTSNPMLAATFRAHAAMMPATPNVESSVAETYMPKDVRAAGAGRFERDFNLVQAIGSGEFSSVWKVRAKADGELWAIKTGRPYTGVKNRHRQLEEVTILRRLSEEQHAHIVRFVDSWEQSGRLYIQTELAECGDLSRFLMSLGDTGGLDEGRVWKLAVELTTALSYIHGNNILHLDFKPANILITREGALKVGDFGMSVLRDKTDSTTPPTHDVRGSYGLVPSALLDRDFEGDREYLCPELLRDETPGPEADVYSLGISILEAALNVVLPSNGDAWVKLRHDDFSDIDEHYNIRGEGVDLENSLEGPIPLVSSTLLVTIKTMMAADPRVRLTLAELSGVAPFVRAKEAMEGRGERKAGPALMEEDGGWTEYVLEG